MSLRSKILLVLCAVVALNTAADHVVQRFMVSRSFVDLEETEANRDLERAVEMIRDELLDLDAQGRQWASWDPTYEYVQGRRADYEADNLGPDALANAGLDLLVLCDAERRVVWRRIEGEGADLRAFGADVLPPFPLFWGVEQARGRAAGVGPADGTSGLMVTERGPLLVSTSPVLHSSGEGPYAGALVLGRFLDAELLAEIGARVQVDLASWTLGEDPLPPEEAALVDRVTAAAGPVAHPVDDETLHSYTTFPDMRQNAALLLRARTSREITGKGLRSVSYALLSTLGTALAILFVLYRLLDRIVLGPLSRLTGHAERIGQTDDTSAKVGMDDRTDEFGSLSREFDAMLGKLAESRAAHAETARMVGMSEIATGVLHNVGNVLNSVNVSTNLVVKRTEQLRVCDLARMVDVLREHEDDLARFVGEDERGKHLLPFLRELSTALSGQREAILGELRGLLDGVEHIMELVRSQQSYAGRTGLYETARLEDQVEVALKISTQAVGELEQLEVVREFAGLEPFPLDRRKVTEILVNVVHNARHAMRDVEGPRRLVLRTLRTPEGRARVEIVDSGVGIPRENLARIFHNGFTTKPDGHGFGLHTAANAATEMKGRLWAESDGEGAGATFVLELPMQSEVAAAA